MAGKLIPKIAAGCLTLVVIGCLSALIGSADTLSDYEKKQKELDRQAAEYQAVIDQTASDIAKQEEYQEALRKKITVLNQQIYDGRTEIDRLGNEIQSLQNDIKDSSDKISQRITGLKQRVKVLYISGETTSLEIILGAKSFEDFIDKVELVAYMSNSDRKLIDKLQNDIDVINKKKSMLDDSKKQLEEEQKKLGAKQAEISQLMDENQALLKNLYESNAGAQDHLDETNAERKAVEDQIKAYYADKAAQEKNAKLRSEAEAKLAASRKAAQSSSKTQSTTQAVSSSTSTAASSVTTSRYQETTTSIHEVDEDSESKYTSYYEQPEEPEDSDEIDEPSSAPEPESSETISSRAEITSSQQTQPVVSSGYVWPTPGHYYLTSEWNEDRDTYNHGAIDIADGSIMNAEIVAAESGTVVLSNNDCEHNYGKDGSCGCGGGYGNYIMIDHGDGKATLYGHMTSLTVTTGDYVQKGQLIGYVGSTGWSTGAHLHFETRLYGEKYNPMTEYPNM